MLRRILIPTAALFIAVTTAACGNGATSTSSSSPSAAASDKPATKVSAPTPSTAEPKPAPPPPQKKLAEILVGSWQYESMELPGVPDATKKQIESQMKNSKLEFKDGKFTSYEGAKVFSSSEYEVEKEEGRSLTIKLTKTKKTETYELPDEDTLTTTDKELGKIVLKRIK